MMQDAQAEVIDLNIHPIFKLTLGCDLLPSQQESPLRFR